MTRDEDKVLRRALRASSKVIGHVTKGAHAMTPEEIAEQIILEFMRDFDVWADETRQMERRIATAIREAEARGLERAAGIAEAMMVVSPDFFVVASNAVLEAVASAIRAEKERQP